VLLPSSSSKVDCGEGIHIMGVAYSTISNNTSANNSGGILQEAHVSVKSRMYAEIIDETRATNGKSDDLVARLLKIYTSGVNQRCSQIHETTPSGYGG
jgi:hypothetical protein